MVNKRRDTALADAVSLGDNDLLDAYPLNTIRVLLELGANPLAVRLRKISSGESSLLQLAMKLVEEAQKKHRQASHPSKIEKRVDVS